MVSAFIDPHGSDVEDILASCRNIRFEDVIYFDPAYTARPMGLNMLEYDTRFPDQKTFVVNEMLSIFNKLFDMKTAGGPMFEQYFRNAVLLTIDDPSSANTLVDVSRVLSNKLSANQSWRIAKILSSFNSGAKWPRKLAGKHRSRTSCHILFPNSTISWRTTLCALSSPRKNLLSIFATSWTTRRFLLVNLSKGPPRRHKREPHRPHFGRQDSHVSSIARRFSRQKFAAVLSIH